MPCLLASCALLAALLPLRWQVAPLLLMLLLWVPSLLLGEVLALLLPLLRMTCLNGQSDITCAAQRSARQIRKGQGFLFGLYHGSCLKTASTSKASPAHGGCKRKTTAHT
jgi:hypothetical protein